MSTSAEPAGRWFWSAVNRTIAAAMLAVLSPLLGACAAAIGLTMGRPIFFLQERTGLGGATFRIVKFRTMRPPSHDGGTEDGPRITPLGQVLRSTSLDELPSLFNIVNGTMVFVGPRPLLPSYLPHYTDEQARRFEVKPGLTGWSQVNGRNALTWDDKLALDAWYVAHKDWRLDARILVRTLPALLRLGETSHPGHSTMPHFRPPR